MRARYRREAFSGAVAFSQTQQGREPARISCTSTDTLEPVVNLFASPCSPVSPWPLLRAAMSAAFPHSPISPPSTRDCVCGVCAECVLELMAFKWNASHRCLHQFALHMHGANAAAVRFFVVSSSPSRVFCVRFFACDSIHSTYLGPARLFVAVLWPLGKRII